MKARILSLLLSICLSLNIFPQTSSGSSMVLRDHWYIQSSANLTDNGKVISQPGYAAKDWYPTSVPYNRTCCARGKQGVPRSLLW